MNNLQNNERMVLSENTFLYKYAQPFPFVAGLILMILAMINQEKKFVLDFWPIVLIIFISCISYDTFKCSWYLKDVYIKNDLIYISNCFKMITIPINEIKEIKQITYCFTKPSDYIMITFDHKTQFGKKILFLPSKKMMEEINITEKLKSLIEKYRRI